MTAALHPESLCTCGPCLRRRIEELAERLGAVERRDNEHEAAVRLTGSATVTVTDALGDRIAELERHRAECTAELPSLLRNVVDRVRALESVLDKDPPGEGLVSIPEPPEGQRGNVPRTFEAWAKTWPATSYMANSSVYAEHAFFAGRKALREDALEFLGKLKRNLGTDHGAIVYGVLVTMKKMLEDLP